ncbi:uracil-DNA glycosylase family protein [Paenibacillus taichungensis]
MLSHEELLRSYDSLKKDYSVKDIVRDESKFLYILESPHKEEIRHRVPVAGSSGRMMTKTIFSRKLSEPLGLLVHSLESDSGLQILRTIGLMNVSPIPLQASAYPESVQREHKSFIEILEKIRVNLSINYHNDSWQYVRSLILRDFSDRLLSHKEQKLTIIPCGKFALTHYKSTSISSPNWSQIIGVPHPSRNQWYQEIQAISEMKQVVNRDNTW